jgi:small subunit ribosomal protein S17
MPAINKTKEGTVLSNRMDKTVVVQVESYRHHSVYKKTMRNVVKYKVHDEKNECAIGDKVRIVETRPLSKEKRWRVSEIIVRAAEIIVKPEEIEPKIIEEKPAETEATAETAAAAAAATTAAATTAATEAPTAGKPAKAEQK